MVTSPPLPCLSACLPPLRARDDQIRAIWKRNRQALLARADACSQAAAAAAANGGAAGTAAAVAAASAATDSVPGRRRVCAVGTGQGRDGGGGKMAKVYYHQLVENKVRISGAAVSSVLRSVFLKRMFALFAICCCKRYDSPGTRLKKRVLLYGNYSGAATLNSTMLVQHGCGEFVCPYGLSTPLACPVFLRRIWSMWGFFLSSFPKVLLLLLLLWGKPWTKRSCETLSCSGS